MKIESLEIKHKREGWREWFITDPPEKTKKLTFWLDGQHRFYIDPTFDTIEINGTILEGDPSFLIPYVFSIGEPFSVEKVYVNSFIDGADNKRKFKACLPVKKE